MDNINIFNSCFNLIVTHSAFMDHQQMNFSAFSSTMFAFAGAPNFPTIQSDMKDRRQFSICVSIAMGGRKSTFLRD